MPQLMVKYPALCTFASFMNYATIGMALYALVIASLDRYIAICKPHHSRRETSAKQIKIVLVVG